MRTPVVLLTGVDPEAMTTAMVGLQFDLPHAVAVRHHIDPEAQLLERVVSDVTGVIEREVIELEHACVSCALREDVVPTLDRLAGDGRWATIVAHLPVGAEAVQVCGVLAWDTRLARRLRVSTVVTALDGADLVGDLLGDALLVERGHHTAPDDTRGVGEVACAMVEYADVVVVTDPPGADDGRGGVDLVTALARPGVPVVLGSDRLDGRLVLAADHDHATTHRWSDLVVAPPMPPLAGSGVWRIDLRSPLAFHPERLLDDLETLGGGPHRSRGHFWLPTRPGSLLAWDGAGGQLSIGSSEAWGRRTPETRVVLTGVGVEPAGLRAAFDALLLGAHEDDVRSPRWQVGHDGFEPWLGPIREVA